MKTDEKLTLKFFKNLAKLLYAIAASDSNIHPLEFKNIEDLVKEFWLKSNSITENDDTDIKYQIETAFGWLNNQNNLDAKSCYNDFVNFKNTHQNIFTNEIKKIIIKTARKLASSFAGINKSELIMLAKLDLELKK